MATLVLDLLFRPFVGTALTPTESPTVEGVLTTLPVRLLYGGVTEEVLVRFGLMTLLAWGGWRLANRGRETSSALRAGIAGTGGLGTRLGEQLNATAEGEVVAPADVSAESRDRAGDRLGVPDDARYEECGTMLRERVLDAVLIATPHTLHHEQVVAAFVEPVEEGTEPPATPEHALRVTAVTEAAYELARTGERVAVDLE